MNGVVYLWLGLASGALVAWYLAVSAESKKKASHIQGLETKLRFSESRALDLNEKLTKAQNDAEVLRKNLAEERDAKHNAITVLNQSLKKGGMVAASCYFFLGVFLAGTVTWFWAGARAEANHIRQVSDFQMNAHLAELKAELLERQLAKLQRDYESLKKNWFQVLEEKTVALAKLEILLQNMVVENGSRGFRLDYKKMKKNWGKEDDRRKVKDDSGMAGIPLPKFS
jgi:hypothetical protein